MQDNTEMARELADIASSAPLDPEEIKVIKVRSVCTEQVKDIKDYPYRCLNRSPYRYSRSKSLSRSGK